MNFLIVTQAEHKRNNKQEIGGYEPYVREMNLWAKHVDQITIIAPLVKEPFGPIDIIYKHPSIRLVEIPEINFTSFRNALYALTCLPVIFYRIFREMARADHIHLRCPGNIGLLGCIAQLFFPAKKKTAKYAGNWDWKSKQPLTYRFQQVILRNTFFTRNMKVLVYGHWPDITHNILPFFTATYSDKDKEPVAAKEVGSDKLLRLLFVGAFSTGKQPLFSVQVAEELHKAGMNIELNMLGKGIEFESVRHYVAENELTEFVHLHGNQPEPVVREYYKKSHMLVFVSKSEGWPKVVAESMFWGCVPITTRVSCVPEMLGENQRGTLVEPDVPAIINAILYYIQHPQYYEVASQNGIEWSRQFTLERFEQEITKLL